MKHNAKLTPYAQDLRNNMTDAEKELWYKFLRTYPFQFRRQVTVGIYILDFYCAKVKLAIELDGSQHYSAEGKANDAKRTAYLESIGIHVIRYSNRVVMSNFCNVCADIDRTVRCRMDEISS